MKNLKHPYSREELRQAMIDNGFASKKTVGKYQDKFSVVLQTEHNQKFAGKFTAFRTILELVHSHE